MVAKYIESPVPGTAATPLGALGTLAARVERGGSGAAHGVWAFLTALSHVQARKHMLATAEQIAAARPELAARLRRAARESWAE